MEINVNNYKLIFGDVITFLGRSGIAHNLNLNYQNTIQECIARMERNIEDELSNLDAIRENIRLKLPTSQRKDFDNLFLYYRRKNL